jgi:GMP synthase-like glutamine amidotransferase
VRILSIVHQPDAGPGVFAQEAAACGAQLELWRPAQGATARVKPRDYDAVLSFGGAMHADQEDLHPWLAEEKRLLARALEQDVPLLGVCLGAQLLAEAAGAPVRRAAAPEIGWYHVQMTEEANRDPLLSLLPSRFAALEWHSYEFPLPPGAVPLAWSETCLQAYRLGERAWGIQFHAEVTLEAFEAWLDDYREDEDAVAMGIAPDALRAQTRASIVGWNQIGRELCGRFLEIADRARVGVQRRSAG